MSANGPRIQQSTQLHNEIFQVKDSLRLVNKTFVEDVHKIGFKRHYPCVTTVCSYNCLRKALRNPAYDFEKQLVFFRIVEKRRLAVSTCLYNMDMMRDTVNLWTAQLASLCMGTLSRKIGDGRRIENKKNGVALEENSSTVEMTVILMSSPVGGISPRILRPEDSTDVYQMHYTELF